MGGLAGRKEGSVSIYQQKKNIKNKKMFIPKNHKYD